MARREVWAVDSETDPFKHGRVPRPFIWGAYNGTEYHEFADAAELVAFLAPRRCVAYAHNGGRFDWHFLLEYLEPHSPLMVISGRLARFKIGECEFRDSYNLMPMPLAAGGKKMVIDYGILEREERDKPKNREIIRERLRTDCLYLFDMLAKFTDEFGVNLTLAGASLAAWSRISKIEKPATTAEFYETLAPFYYGGRVECFELGEIRRPFKVIDINSAYPFAMIHEHPWETVPMQVQALPKTRGAIERSFIELETDSRGAFPYRSDDGSLEFPYDRQARVFRVTGWEYLAALETNALKSHAVRSVTVLGGTVNFRSYMDHFYKMKTDAKSANDPARYAFAKTFLNSLYGKFGANPDEYREYTIVSPQFIEAACEADGYSFCGEVGPWALLSREIPDSRKRFYNVAVAASITGFVRAYLWRALNRCSGIIYCDTDSIVCEQSGDLPLHAENLGAWDVEAECRYGAVAGKKLYAFETLDGHWKTASKGVRLGHDEIVRIARGEEIDFHPENPQFSIKNGVRFISRKVRRTGKARV